MYTYLYKTDSFHPYLMRIWNEWIGMCLNMKIYIILFLLNLFQWNFLFPSSSSFFFCFVYILFFEVHLNLFLSFPSLSLSMASKSFHLTNLYYKLIKSKKWTQIFCLLLLSKTEAIDTFIIKKSFFFSLSLRFLLVILNLFPLSLKHWEVSLVSTKEHLKQSS